MRTGFKKLAYYQTLETVDVSRNGQCFAAESDVLKESIIEVSVNGIPSFRITCTPSSLHELAAGRLFTEGFISDMGSVKSIDIAEDMLQIEVCLNRNDKPEKHAVVEEVPTAGGASEVIRRYTFSTAALEPYEPVAWDMDVVFNLCDSFTRDTPLHARTSGTHSCYLAVDGEVVFVSEDIGRHNALDKTIGYALLNSIDFSQAIVFISGRVPVDMIAKAIRAKIPVLASKAAPTDEAVKLARKYGLTLICSATNDCLKVYSGAGYVKRSLRAS